MDIERDAAKQMFDQAQTQAQAIKHQIATLRTKLRALENISGGFLELYPDLAEAESADARDDDAEAPITVEDSQVAGVDHGQDHFDLGADDAFQPRPAGLTAIEVVALIVAEMYTGRGALSVGSVHDEMKRRGWLPEGSDPMSAVRVALARAKRDGLVESVPLDKRSNGYRPATPKNTSAPDESGAEAAVTTTDTGGDSNVQPDRDHGDHSSDRIHHRDDRGGASVEASTF